MAAGDGAVRVPPTPQSAPRLGLLPSALHPDLPEGWLNGIIVQPETCLGDVAVPGGYWWDDCTDTTAPDGTLGQNGRTTPRTWIPVQLNEGDTCSAEGWTAQDYEARARRTLLANQARKVELELWAGRANAVGGLGNDWLANPSTCEDLGDAPLVYALGELVQYLADTIPGRGMIHAEPRLVQLWWSAYLLRREGNVLYENTADHIIVPGTGYPGTGIDDPDHPGEESGVAASISGSTAYATSMINVVFDDVIVHGGWGDNLDRDTNEITFRAQQAYLAWWDSCAHAGINVDHANPCLNNS